MGKKPPEEKPLTILQESFVEEYLADTKLNAMEAAIRAGYSKKTAKMAGHNNLRKPNVRAAIQKRRKEMGIGVISPEEVLAEYVKIAKADIKDFLTFRTEKAVVDHDENGTPIFGYVPILEMKDSDDVDGSMISEVSLTDKGTLKVKLHDKHKALEQICKLLGLTDGSLNINFNQFNNTTNISNSEVVNITRECFQQLPPDRREALVRILDEIEPPGEDIS